MQFLSKQSSRIRKAIQALLSKRDTGSNSPIFIVGCGHSGTSILLAILGAHSRICAVPYESYLACDLATMKPRPRDEAKAMIRGFDALVVSEKKARWVEKTPIHVRFIAELFALCPECKILLIIRDGRDVACSLQDRNGDLQEGIDRWVLDNTAGEEFWNNPNVHVLKYENLVEDYQGTMLAVMQFLGEKFEKQMANYYKVPKLWYAKELEKPPDAFGPNHEKFRNWQINQPFFDGRGKWKRLSEDEKRVIKSAAGKMLIKYGYTDGDGW